MLEETRLRCGKTLALERISLIPIEQVRIEAHDEQGGLWMRAELEAAAVVICEDDTVRVLDRTGQVLGLDELLVKVDGLQASIDECLGR